MPVTSTKAPTNATLLQCRGDCERRAARGIARDRLLARGVNVLEGKITYEAVAEAHGLDYTPLEDVLPLSYSRSRDRSAPSAAFRVLGGRGSA